MADSHSPPTFNHPLWQRCIPPANCFSVTQESVKGTEQKNLTMEIINSHCSKMDQILIYCRSMGPNLTQTHPTWMVACVAFHQGQEIGQWTMVLGQNSSARDTAFQAVAVATDLAKDLLATSPSHSVMLFTADHFVLSYCQVTNHHDNATTCRAICNTAANILSTHPNTSLSI
jgi:hypothetical protein